MILSKNLILPTTTFFQYGNTSKKKQAFSVWDFQKFRLTPISEGGFGISSLPENIGSEHPLHGAGLLVAQQRTVLKRAGSSGQQQWEQQQQQSWQQSLHV